MKKFTQSHIEHSLTASNRPHLSEAQIDQAKQRVWNTMSDKLLERQATRRFSWNPWVLATALEAGISAALIVALIITSIHLVKTQSDLKLAQSDNSDLTSTLKLAQGKLGEQSTQTAFFVPEVVQPQLDQVKDGTSNTSTNNNGTQATPVPQASLPVSGVALASPAPQEAQGDLDIDENLYQLVGKGITNASAGVRNENSVAVTTLWNRLFPKAHAADVSQKVYPVVFSVQNTLGSKYALNEHGQSMRNIYQTNMVTGEEKLIVAQKNEDSVYAVDFNQKSQSIVYSVARGEWTADKSVRYTSTDIVMLNLTTNKETVILSRPYSLGGVVSVPKWSPDGRQIAYTITTGDTIRMILYQAAAGYQVDFSFTKQDLKKKLPDVINIMYVDGLSWSPDGLEVVFGVVAFTDRDNEGGHTAPNGAWVSKYWSATNPVRFKLSSSSFVIDTESLNRNDTLDETVAIQGKLIGRTFDRTYETFKEHEAQQANGSEYGWIASYDTASKKGTDLDASSANMADWIATQSGSDVVYSGMPGNGRIGPMSLKRVNVSTGTVTEYASVSSLFNFHIVGWNGSEKNLILWSGDGSFYNLNFAKDKLTRITKF